MTGLPQIELLARGSVDPLQASRDDRFFGFQPAQVALAWLMAQKLWIVPIPGTTKLTRLEETIGAVDVELTVEDLAEIRQSVSSLAIEGARYPERLLAATGR